MLPMAKIHLPWAQACLRMTSPVRERPDHAVAVAEDAPTLYMLPAGRLSLWESPRVEHFRNLSAADGGHMVPRL